MSVADDIKARLDLVAYVSETVPLKKAGRNYNARCPFHQERTPSFVVFPETQSWRCFGACAEGGDIFSYAMKQNGWDFMEALEHLAQRAGVELQPRTPEQSQKQAAFERMLGLLEETATFFQDQLAGSVEASGARTYVAGRSLNDETIQEFRLGYAPDGWQVALEHLAGLGYSEDDVVAAGVAIRNDRGRVYDRFRHRLIIPIRDGRGRVIGFGARALRDEDNPKYLNSPQSEVFDKSRTLYGLDTARREIRETETAIIVEGYMDVMQAYQAGFRNVVAQMGTALTEEQLQILRRYADRLILALDADQAGVQATMRGLEVARQSLDDGNAAILGADGSMRRAGHLGIDMRVLEITSGKDPDDLIRENPAEFRRLVQESEPVADYVIRVGTADLDPVQATPHEKEKVARQLLPLLTAAESDLQKEANVQKLAYKLHLPEKRLMEIALESRAAMARRRPTDERLRQHRPTTAMQQAQQRYRRPEPPPPQAPRREQPVTESAPPAPPRANGPVDGPIYDEDFDDGLVDILPPAAQSMGTWEEGPRLDEALLVPVAEDDEMATLMPPQRVEPGPTADAPIPVVLPGAGQPTQPGHFAIANPLEEYVLALLLRKPSALYMANRALRELTVTAQKRFADSARQVKVRQALTSLNADDFQDPVDKKIFTVLQEALNQDDMETLEYLQQAVDAPIYPRLEELWGLLDQAEKLRLPLNKHREIDSVYKQIRKQGGTIPNPEGEIVTKVFEMRRARLRQTKEQLDFIVLEADGEERTRYQDQIDATKVSIFALDKSCREANALN